MSQHNILAESTIKAFVLWLWLIFFIVLACAELSSCIEHETGIYRGKAATQSADG